MNTQNDISRRSFLGHAPAAGALLCAGATVAKAAEKPANKTPPTIRLGVLNVGAYSHLTAKWGMLLNPRTDRGEISYTGMHITHCWDIDPKIAQQFGETYDCTAVRDFDAMLGKVDAIISGGYYNHPYNHLLHEPYLQAGLPNLINRPLTNSIHKAQQIVDLAQRHQAPLLVPSSMGHNDVVSQAREFVHSSPLLGYHAVVGAEDYPTHGIHGLYMLSRAIVDMGNPIQSVSFRAENWHSSPGLLTYEHQDQNGRPFFGTLQTGEFGVAAMQIHTKSQPLGRSFTLTTGTGDPYNVTEFWLPLLWVFERLIRTGQMPQSYEQILQKNRAFLAGWQSHLVKQGQPVKLEDVFPQWEAPVELPQLPPDPTWGLLQKRFG